MKRLFVHISLGILKFYNLHHFLNQTLSIYRTGCKSRRSVKMGNLTASRCSLSDNKYYPEGSQRRNLSHSPVWKMKRGLSQWARNVKRIESRPEVKSVKTREELGICMRRAASLAGSTCYLHFFAISVPLKTAATCAPKDRK